MLKSVESKFLIPVENRSHVHSLVEEEDNCRAKRRHQENEGEAEHSRTDRIHMIEGHSYLWRDLEIGDIFEIFFSPFKELTSPSS
jgi:hypothetical protein